MKTIILFLVAAVIISGWSYKEISDPPGPVSERVSLQHIPTNFGYQTMWFAVKTNDPQKLADVLGLQNQAKSDWDNGTTQAYADKVFVTPTIGQWTLAVGFDLLCPNIKTEKDDLKCFTEKINLLCKTFGEAQLFVTYRSNDYYLWAKSINGKIKRLYFYIGEINQNVAIEGEPTPIEKSYNLVNTLSPEAKKDSNYLDRTDLVLPDQDLVMKVAGSWSIDPNQLVGRKDISPGLGIVGK